MKEENAQLEVSLDHDSALRRDNLVISGLKLAAADIAGSGEMSSSTRLVDQVVKLCVDQLGCDVGRNDISCAYLVGSRAHNHSNGNVNANKLVVVRFVRRSIRDDVYAAKSQLKAFNRATGEKIYINKDLPQALQKLFNDLRQKFKNKLILGTWSKNNKLYVKKLNGSIITVS